MSTWVTVGSGGSQCVAVSALHNTKQMLAEMRKQNEMMTVPSEGRAKKSRQIEKREADSKAGAIVLSIIIAIVVVIYANTSHGEPSSPSPAHPTYESYQSGGYHPAGFVRPDYWYNPDKPTTNGSYQNYSDWLTFCV